MRLRRTLARRKNLPFQFLCLIPQPTFVSELEQMMMGWPFSTWEWIVKASLIIAVVTGVATAFFAFVAGYVGYELADATAKVSDQKLADARGIAEIAKADAAKSYLEVTQSKVRIALLGKESALLSADAAASKSEIAKANARAAEAQLALERFKAPRDIETERYLRLIDDLKPFNGTKAAIFILGEGPEPAHLATILELALERAGWVQHQWFWSGGGAVSGVVVFYDRDGGDRVESAATNLATSLTTAGVNALVSAWGHDWNQYGGMLNGPVNPSPIEASIRIVIGTKQ